jgi:hypothetical protein
VGICGVDLLDALFDNMSVFRELYVRGVEDAAPYNRSEQLGAVLGTNSNEIGPILTVIKCG